MTTEKMQVDDLVDLMLGSAGRLALVLRAIFDASVAVERQRRQLLTEALDHIQAARRLPPAGSAPAGTIASPWFLPCQYDRLVGYDENLATAIADVVCAARCREQHAFDSHLSTAASRLSVVLVRDGKRNSSGLLELDASRRLAPSGAVIAVSAQAFERP